jgi:hypothetical protein
MEPKLELVTVNGKEYQLDIEQAKKLNLLKEKDDRVRSWKEFINKHLNSNSFYCSDGTVHQATSPYYLPEQLTPHEAKALAAFSKLLKLRRDWIGEWEPDWSDTNVGHGIIWVNKNEVKANVSYTIAFPLSFPKYKMAEEFLETFSDLIEEAKTLI